MSQPTSRSGAIPVSAPPRVHATLRAAPDGPVPVVHRGAHAVYVEVGGWCLGVVDALAARVPCALRTAGHQVPETGTARVEDGVLHLDGRALAVGRYDDVRVPRILVPDGPGAAPLTATRVRAMVGAGEGLTPYGDDVLCGWLAAHRAVGVATPEIDEVVRSVLFRTTLLSATLLDCALRGEVLPEFAAWLRAAGGPDEDLAAGSLQAIGHTSGAGLRRGALRAFGELRRSGHVGEVAA